MVDIFGEVQRIAKAMGQIAAGVDTWTKARPQVPEGGIKMDHTHAHVIPSNPGDEIYDTGVVWTPDRFRIPEDTEIEEMVALLK